jgi:hypothetical protein
MWTAIVWIGQYGSWSRGGFDTRVEALRAALDAATDGTFGTRWDLAIEAKLS